MASRYSSSDTAIVTNPTNPTVSSGSSTNTSQSTSNSSSFNGITDANALKALQALIAQLASGGTEADKKQQAERTQTIDDTRAAAADYSKDAAFQDAADLISQSLQASMEKNMPAISKSIQGAGTSASSMQGLLSQRLATDAAQSAGALGAQQATSYGGITAQLSSVLEKLTQSDPTNTNALINALGLLKNTTSSSSSQSTSSGSSSQSSSGGGGGGSRVVSIGDQTQQQSSGQASTAYTPETTYYNSGYITYEVPSGTNSWANYSGEGYQGTSNDLPSGYMDITNTTDSSDSNDYYW